MVNRKRSSIVVSLLVFSIMFQTYLHEGEVTGNQIKFDVPELKPTEKMVLKDGELKKEKAQGQNLFANPNSMWYHTECNINTNGAGYCEVVGNGIFGPHENSCGRETSFEDCNRLECVGGSCDSVYAVNSAESDLCRPEGSFCG